MLSRIILTSQVKLQVAIEGPMKSGQQRLGIQGSKGSADSHSFNKRYVQGNAGSRLSLLFQTSCYTVSF